MRMDICTLPRTRLLSTLLCAAFTITALYPLAGAEEARRNARAAQAELHIQVIIAPVVFPPHRDHDRDRDRDEAAIAYNLSPSMEKLSISQEVRTMQLDGGKHEQVQLTTVVMR